MTTSREDLTSRTLPSMTLAKPYENPTPGTESDLTSATATPQTRFAAPRSVIITGGTGALGTAISHALLQHGTCHLALFDIETTSPASQTLAATLRSTYPHATISLHQVDVTDAAAVESATATVAATRITTPSDSSRQQEEPAGIDALICTAGIVHTAHALDTSPETFRRILDINTTGSFLCAQAAARQMISGPRHKGGSIVFTASVSAHRVNFPQPQVAYNVSKGALLMLARSLAAEWARHGIRVNSVSPGYLDTVLNEGPGLAHARDLWASRTPAGRMGRVEEVASVMLMLVCPSGSYVTGTDVVVDGGLSVF